MSLTRQKQKAETREHLYRVAMSLFDEHGYENVNVDDIVRAAEVARGTFYFHFAKKDEVLLEAIRRGERLIIAKLADVTELRPLLDATTQGFAEAWGHRRALLVHAGTLSLHRIAAVPRERDSDPLRRELAERVQHTLDNGELPSVLPAQTLADVFLLNVFAGLMAWASSGEPNLDVVMQAVVDLFLRGATGFGAR